MSYVRSGDRPGATRALEPRRGPRDLALFVSDRDGTAALEFALLAPVFLALLLGTLVYGLYFGIAHSVQQLASEAARASVSGLTEQERGQLAQRYVSRALASYGLLKPTALRVAAAFDPSDPDLFKVTVTYDASGLGLKLFDPLLPSPGAEVARSAMIRRGGA